MSEPRDSDPVMFFNLKYEHVSSWQLTDFANDDKHMKLIWGNIFDYVLSIDA